LTGKYVQGEPAPEGSRLEFWTPRPTFTLSDENFNRIRAFTDFATARGRTIIELAMSWLASRPGIATVVAGATTPDQVRENASAADWKLTAEDLDEVAQL
jgi:aryl-alcohol dehydrogenase-like predicted oxidoreductase